ncbi:FHA domain-containing protein [Allofournierella sp.]|uniref:FHA domain-containing protein n=1 Tax=Allofournierella sp. TaxID=1940256 RepID=UPI003AB54C5B
MNMQQCPNGHFYDAERGDSCPYCQGVGHTRPLTAQPLPEVIPATAPAVPGGQEALPKTLPLAPHEQPAETPAIPPTAPLQGETGATMPLGAGQGGSCPTLGWLVCVEGKKRGRDYRVCTDRCYIGRGQSNDISLEFDSAVSRDTHLLLCYNRLDRTFWLDASQSKNNVYLAGQLVLQPVCLQHGDIFTLGQTSLRFVPLCGPDFAWE